MLALDADQCYRAMRARDPRFDGVFYVGVQTTGVYCRPICPARTPGRARCVFFTHPAEAERAGFRACFRCRPEVAPRAFRGQAPEAVAPVDARGALSRRAAALVEEGFLDEHSVDELGARLGVTGRHLRRVMEQELGVSPVELAQARRLGMAKQLLHDTRLPLAEVAFAAGFGSLRRFNTLFQLRFGRSPSSVRRAGVAAAGEPAAGGAGQGTIRLRLDYRPPLDWEALLAFLGARAIPGIERVEGTRYARVVVAGGRRRGAAVRAGVVEVEPDARALAAGRASLVARVPVSLSAELPRIAARLRALFDLDARPDVIAEHLGHDPRLAPSLRAHPGLRVPGAFDGWEMAVRALLGQQVTVRGATTLCARFVERFGERVETGVAGLDRRFPGAARIAALPVEQLARIGLPAARARALSALSLAVLEGRLPLDGGGALDPDRFEEAALALPGIGPWTASYLALRALRWPDAFPAGDLGVQRALGTNSPRRAEERSGPWRPFRAYAVMHLWTTPPDDSARGATLARTA